MDMSLEEAKREFSRLVTEKFGSEELLAFLLEMRERDDLTPDDRGWVLWNICDHCAMAGDSVSQHQHQVEFFELVKQSFRERAHWVVCDATQANALIRGGHTDFWWGCYQFANQHAPCLAESRGARFEAHRANAGSYAHFRNFDRAQVALDALAALLEEDPEWGSQEFASATYQKLLIVFYGVTEQMDRLDETAERLEKTLFSWHARISGAPSGERREPLLFGSWKFFNAVWPSERALRVAMVNTGCACAENGRFAIAERLFRPHWGHGQPLTAYCAARFLQSCWNNRHDREEIAKLLAEARSLTAEYLVEIAPETAEAVEGMGL